MEILLKIIGLIIILNILNQLYYRFGNHGWSRSGYYQCSKLGIVTSIINYITFVIIVIYLLFLYFTF